MSADDKLNRLRRYQKDILEFAKTNNTICVLETGMGKTMVAIGLVQHIKQSAQAAGVTPKITFFLAPTCNLTVQQADAARKELKDVHVVAFVFTSFVLFSPKLLFSRVLFMCLVANGRCTGDTMTYSYDSWRSQFGQPNSLVCMTPQVFLDSLRHAFVSLEEVDLVVFDECHNSKKNNPCNLVMTEFYFPAKDAELPVPKILGLTASPATGLHKFRQQLEQLERDLDSVAFTSTDGVDEIRQDTREEILAYDEDDDPRVPQKYVDMIDELKAKGERKVVTNANRCLGELGEWGLQQVLLAKDGVRPPVPRMSFAKWRASGLLNDKVITLISFLQEFPDKSSFHGIIFCQCIVVCQLLAELIQNIDDLEWVRCVSVTGHGTKGTKGMSGPTQMKAVEKFRQKIYNLMVATSVLEEGLDVGTCEIVIRFNPPQTLQSSIQSKGRARKGQSRYVVMSSTRETIGSETAEYRKKVKELENERDIFAVRSHPKVVKYVSEKTGAIATLASAVSLVNRWCSACHGQPQWTYKIIRDEFSGSVRTRASCLLCEPAPQVPIVLVRDNYMKEKSIKKELSLMCVQFLHEHGLLDDFLLPSSENLDHRMFAGRQLHLLWTSNGNQPLCAGREPRVSMMPPTRAPAAMARPLVPDQEMHQTSLIVTAAYDAPDDTSVQVQMPYALVSCRCLFREPFDVAVPNATNMGTIHVEPSVPAMFTSEQLDLARQCTEVLFESVVKGSTRKNLSFDWSNTSRSVVVLPLVAGTNTPDWDMCKTVVERSAQMKAGSCGLAKLPQVFHPRDMIKCAMALYHAVQPAPGVTMNSKTEHEPNKTYAEDIFEKRQIVLQDPAAPFFSCTVYSNRIKDRNNVAIMKRFYVPSEIATLWPLRVDMQATMGVLAENFWKLEHCLLVEELIHAEQFPIFRPEFGQFSPDKRRRLLVQALTAAAVARPLYGNYEKLEFLGDVVLKYGAVATIVAQNKDASIGQLVVKKSDVVSNETLFQMSTLMQLPEMLQTENSPWTRGCFPGTSNEAVHERPISNKTIADCVESLTGACFALMLDDDGPTLLQQCTSPEQRRTLWLQHHLAWANALHFLEECGHPLMQQVEIEAFARAFKRDMAFSALSEATLQGMQSVLCIPVTARGLLEAAFTHQSVSLQRNYEVLEFLGDAVLDGVVTQQLFQWFGADPRVSVGQLSSARSTVVENDTLAYLALRLGLDRHIRCSAPERECIERYKSVVDKALAGAFVGRRLKKVPRRLFGAAPKILADVFEACVAVVFLESGGSMVRTADVVVPWVAEVLDHVTSFDDMSSVVLRRCIREWKDASMCPEVVVNALPRGSACDKIRVEAKLQWFNKTDPAHPVLLEEEPFEAEGWTSTTCIENICDLILASLTENKPM